MSTQLAWFFYGWGVAHLARVTIRVVLRGSTADYRRGWRDAMHQEHPPKRSADIDSSAPSTKETAVSDQPESCGMCWRGPGSNRGCAEHREDYTRRLEADAGRLNDQIGNVYGVLGRLERMDPEAVLPAREVANWIEDALRAIEETP